jgi:ubiquitin-protein ligase
MLMDITSSFSTVETTEITESTETPRSLIPSSRSSTSFNMSGLSKTITIEISRMHEYESLGIYYHPKERNEVGNMYGYLWTATLYLNEDAPYTNKEICIDIVLPLDYPYRGPEFNLQTNIYHPNVGPVTGKIYLDVLEKDNWRPILRLGQLLLTILSVLNEPEKDTNYYINMEAHLLYKNDIEQYREKVKEYESKVYKGYFFEE